MSKHTDLYVLALVAVVAVVAILAMVISAPSAAEAEPQVDFVPAERVQDVSVQPTRSFVAPEEADHDFNGNGRVDSQDVQRLADAIAENRCPASKDCDVNNDGSLDELDIGLLRAMVPAPSFQANAVAEPTKSARPPARVDRGSDVAAALG